jgi:saccharopine dehydrogenase-like NADP-dependent oxidoreductase
MSRIVVFGAYGRLGRVLSADLADDADDNELILAGRNAAALEELVAGMPGRVSVVRIDATDREAALPVLGGADLMVNCIGLALVDELFDLAVNPNTAANDHAASQSARTTHPQARKMGLASRARLAGERRRRFHLSRTLSEPLRHPRRCRSGNRLDQGLTMRHGWRPGIE